MCVFVCVWALLIQWHALHTFKYDIKAEICQNAVIFGLISRVFKSLLGTHALSIFNRSPKFGLKLPQVVLNWKQVRRYVTTWRLLTIATWLIHGYPYPQSSHFFHLTNLGLVRPGTPRRVLFSYVCTFLTFLALQTYWHTLQTSNCDNQAILLRFALISRVKFFKTLVRLMLAIEARNLTKICNQ